jgi:LacI family repressor for deo operon, udp, cdd, tsx, nupC, and nupG
LINKVKRPTALFCFSDEMAMGAMDAARRQGVSVPGDLSIVGFDDLPCSRYLSPSLTTIAQPVREIGESCVRLLLDILQGKTVDPVSVRLPHTLMVRSTTAPPSGHSYQLSIRSS